jgi:predicted Zn-ribbon and HTH transcriptional regulator
MISIFNNINIRELEFILDDDERILKYIADEKWRDGFICRKCGHTNFCKGKKPYSRRCTKCKSEESAIANTIFHACKMKLSDAFRIAHLVCTKPKISSYELSREMKIRQMTCWRFKKKISECLLERNDLSDDTKIEIKDILLNHK